MENQNTRKQKSKLISLIMNTAQNPEINEEIKEYVDDKPSVIDRERSRKGETALTIACLNYNTCSSIETVKLLLNLGANPNVQDEYHRTPIIKILRKETLTDVSDLIGVLISGGADPNFRDAYGMTPLMLLLDRESENIDISGMIQVLISGGAKPNLVRVGGFETALSFAMSRLVSIKNPENVLTTLLKNGADPNIRDSNGATIFNTRSVYAGFPDQYSPKSILKILLDYGINVNAQCNKGYTVLMNLAILPINSPKNKKTKKMVKEIEEIAVMLLSYGAKPNLQNKFGNTALMHASETHTNLVRILLESGADPKLQNRLGDTPLIFAIIGDGSRSNKYAIKLLIKYGVGVNTRKSCGLTPLMVAIGSGYRVTVDIVRILLNHGADPNILAYYGENVLLHAINCPQLDSVTDIIELLLNHGTDPNVIDKYGRSALMGASLNNEPKKIIRLLVLAGAKMLAAPGNSRIQMEYDVLNYMIQCFGDKTVLDDIKKTFYKIIVQNIRMINSDFRFTFGGYGQKIVMYNAMLRDYNVSYVYEKITENHPELLDYLSIHNPKDLTKLGQYIDMY